MILKHTCFTAIFIAIFSFQTNAQTPYLSQKWEQNHGQLSSVFISKTVIDAEDNSYVLGNSIVDNGLADITLVKYNQDGELVWSFFKDGGAQLNDYGTSLIIDSEGNLVGTGVTGVNQGQVSMYVFKMDRNGTLIWETNVQLEGYNSNIPIHISEGPAANLYVVGAVAQIQGNSDIALIKLSASGIPIWETSYDHAGFHDAPSKVEATIDGVFVTAASGTSFLDWDIIALKYDPASSELITEQRVAIPGPGYDEVTDVAIDQSGKMYLTGHAESAGVKKMVTMKFDQDLNVEWASEKSFGIEDKATCLSLDESGNVIISGVSLNSSGKYEMSTIKYDPNGGELWSISHSESGGSKDVISKDIMVNSANEIIVVGTADKGENTQAAIVKYDTHGERIRSDYFGEADADFDVHEIVLGTGSKLHITGKKESSSGATTTTMLIEEHKLSQNIVELNGHAHHLAGHVMASFLPNVLNMEAVDNKYRNSGHLHEFLTQNALEALSTKFGMDLSHVNAFKVFSRLTSSTTQSISRDGQSINMPKFWTYLLLDFNEITTAETASSILNDVPSVVEIAQLNHVFESSSPPNDPLYADNQAMLHPTAAFQDWGVNIESAWELEIGGNPELKIGILDTGVFAEHEDFIIEDEDGLPTGSVVTGGYNFYHNENLGQDLDPHNHGTKSAGIITALRNNETGIAGIVGGDFDSSLDEPLYPSPFYTLKITDDAGNTYSELYNNVYASEMDFCEALVEASTDAGTYGYGIDILNASWGHLYTSQTAYTYNLAHPCLLKSMYWMHKNGVIMICSRGNFGSEASYIPATLGAEMNEDDWVITVGASNPQGQRVDSDTNWSAAYGNLDISAPGLETVGLTTSSTNADIENNQYESYGGTSQSAPLVSGVAALMWNHHNSSNDYANNLSIEDIEYIMENYNQGSNNESFEEIGHGILDATEALQRIDKPIYGFEIVHSQDPTTSSFEIVSDTQESYLVGENVYGMPEGEYLFSTYVIEQTYEVQLEPNQIILDYWPRHSASKSGPAVVDGFEITYLADEFEMEPYEILEDNVISVTTRTHTRLCTVVQHVDGDDFVEDLAETFVGTYFPAHFDEINTAFSLYTMHGMTTELEDQSSSAFVRVFPNPMSEQVSIVAHAIDQSVEKITFYDSVGRTVLVQNHTGTAGVKETIAVNTSALSSGAYILAVEFDSGDRQSFNLIK